MTTEDFQLSSENLSIEQLNQVNVLTLNEASQSKFSSIKAFSEIRADTLESSDGCFETEEKPASEFKEGEYSTHEKTNFVQNDKIMHAPSPLKILQQSESHN